MDPPKEEDEELIFYEIQDQSMFFGNAIIIMILFGLIGTDIDRNNFTLTRHDGQGPCLRGGFQRFRSALTFFLFE